MTENEKMSKQLQYIKDESAKSKRISEEISLILNNQQSDQDHKKKELQKVLEREHLASLNLLDYRIGADGAKALADALVGNATMTSLNLRDNSIGAEGAKALADALVGNATMTSLDLGYNSIDAVSYTHLTLPTKRIV